MTYFAYYTIIKKIAKAQFLIFVLLFSSTLYAQNLAEPVMLPNGWNLTPAGKQLPLGDLPLNMAISHDQKLIAVTNNGYGRQCVQIFDTRRNVKTDDKTIKASWYGLCFSPDGKRLYASAGNINQIMIYDVDKKGNINLADSIVMGKPWPTKISPAGIAIAPKTNQLYVVTRWDNSLYIYDLNDKHLIRKEPLGGEGYSVVISKDGEYAYASCWGHEEVVIWNINKENWEKRIKVGSHPNEMCIDEKHHRLFVANADDNSVSVINLNNLQVEETLNAALYGSTLSGSTTNGLCIANDGKKLVVANADNNCLTLFDISHIGQSRGIGFIPVGWYPTNVKCTRNKLWVTNGKGLRSKANPNGPRPIDLKVNYGHHTGDKNKTKGVEYIAKLFLGAMSIIDMPNEAQLKEYTLQVFNNTPYTGKSTFKSANNYSQDILNKNEIRKNSPIPQVIGEKSPIKYVFYIIKENRTYDQILGDMSQGNGDSTLTIFGRKYTPNLHKLAQDYVLLDNFYVNAEVSCDGHNWTMGAYANDYLEKTWPSYYSGRGDVYSGEGGHHMGNNKSGFFWDLCKNGGVSYRSYGEFLSRKKIKDEKTPGPIQADIPVLKEHFCPTFEPWSLEVRDTVRYRQWATEFDSLLSVSKVPKFNTVRFGGDHTEGMKLGRPSPYAHVADNDLAVGMFIEHLSQSPIWKEAVVFIIEDDAQNGADHVDAHRSTVYIAGGMVKHHYVDSTPYTTSSILRTMELILGLPPMSQYDAAAQPVWRCFTNNVDLTPYRCLPENISLNDVNLKKNKWQVMSERYNFAVEDDVPDVEFNQVLWHGLKGDKITYPSIHRSAFLKYTIDDDDD
jgi:YVTN family beta-propeller protein